jgi:uncharacterized membrane protein YeaQ/YmgE (transglycosylase-associated protein family)
VGILVAILGAFFVGALGRLAVPGPDPMPWWLTTLIGFGGSVIGGVVGLILFGHGLAYHSFAVVALEIAGASLLVILYRRYVQHRPITGPEAQRPPSRGFGFRRRY